jgi:ubiquinone biosynthesis protein
MNGSEQVEKNTEKRINRIVFSLILLAVSIVTAGLIISLGFSTQAGLEIFESYITALKVSLFTFVAVFIGLVFSVIRSK